MKNLLLPILFFIFLLTASCTKPKVEEVVEGLWSIDTIIFKGYEIRNCLSVNAFSFEEVFCDLPVIIGDCGGFEEHVDNGSWEITVDETKPLVLKIRSDNYIFSGEHQMIFKADDKNRLLKLVLISDSLYVVCRKGLFDYDHHPLLVKELIHASK